MNPFEDMRIFCQVMDSGSFTAAADQLGLSKQFVSRRLMQLEERLGVRLLNRSTRRLDVTPLGQSYYESALRLLGEVESVEQGIAGQTAEPRGAIRVSAPLSFALAHLGCLLPPFLQRYREVTVEVDLSDRPVDLLGEGYDLALRIGVLEDSTLIARRIAEGADKDPAALNQLLANAAAMPDGQAEIVAGVAAHSAALKADALDFLHDSALAMMNDGAPLDAPANWHAARPADQVTRHADTVVQVEGGQVGLVLLQAEAARQHILVISQGGDGGAAEGFGLVAHLGQLAAFFGLQADQADERSGQRQAQQGCGE